LKAGGWKLYLLAIRSEHLSKHLLLGGIIGEEQLEVEFDFL
jgi:hypothetical protein